MADLSSVLRKTIDALPSATPQLRAKVYEKARAAIQRQIDAANPPLSPEMVEARRRALEQAIASTEEHYAGGGGTEGPSAAPEPAPHEPPPPPAPREEPESPAEVPTAPPPAEPVAPSRTETPPVSETPPPPLVRQDPPKRASFDAPPSSAVAQEETVSSPEPAEPHRERIGEVGPVSQAIADEDGAAAAPPEPAVAAAPEEDNGLDAIPQADMAAPSYSRQRRRSGNGSLYAGLAALLFVGALGAAGYYYGDEISRALTGSPQVASTGEETDPPLETEGEVAAVEPETEPDTPAADAETTPAAPDPGSRAFTQRLLPDGSEVDEGPAAGAPNAFEEGTDVAAASLISPLEEPVSPQVTEEAPSEAAAGDPQAIAVAQRAVFYEERSEERPGSQMGGNVVWSVVNEPPAAGQPPEPAIRAVADVSDTELQMTMTIRRNADETLPASHVIEIIFDVPDNFPGGEIENVQRLALKPTEQARGEPLIGVAGRISDGFFIIALNDLQQAVDNNLNLMANEQWIDIPLAYSTGQRALISLEKGIPGDRVFREALDAWAERT